MTTEIKVPRTAREHLDYARRTYQYANEIFDKEFLPINGKYDFYFIATRYLLTAYLRSKRTMWFGQADELYKRCCQFGLKFSPTIDANDFREFRFKSPNKPELSQVREIVRELMDTVAVSVEQSERRANPPRERVQP
jgi:hypothetical protein